MDYSTLAMQLFLTGIFLSSLYILVTFGLTMIFGVMEIVNFAHASFAILGGYACLLAVTSLGMDPFVALVPVVAFMALVGWLTFEFFARYTLDVGDAHVVHYYALLLIISNVLALIFGLDYKFVPSGLGYSQIELGPFKYPLLKFLVAIISLATVAGLSLYLKKSVIGKKIRAVSQSKESAEIMGIDSLKIRRITWIIGVSSAGLMGALVGLVNPFSPYAGTTYLIVAFSVAILGGMGSLFGTIVAGFIIGMTESLFSLFLPSQISPVVAFVFIIGVLMVKPEGLFSRA
ncbi:MAG: branched-chain amino acid ABC transporter permease [Proteobacteria bacterium]|nr:branched-chain amino acid ABC transporter permease [Pseudomonadota bacterium]MBU4275837.1 branched-chain amino acid ABC transporter permease [Pseudomonadota bacterium]MBU4383872.1 branched-chain amino acid ABC transporter permease [Pseudomonadota bacterium]MBU4604188.1 branched-chain amino acid ABC transporter permease [Pseudomonadota bacterium]MCG2763514.1 branched-chain amino acid ABC transporter permease [Desulfarculaceae bacterium]